MTSTKNAGTQFHGTYEAVVVSRVDPENNDRLLVKIPQVLGTAVSIWAKPQNEINTNSKVGDKLRVQFHGGDITKPSYHVDATHPWEHPLNNISQKFTQGPAVFYGQSMHKSIGVGVDPKERGLDQLGNVVIGQDLYTDRDHHVSGTIYANAIQTNSISSSSLNMSGSITAQNFRAGTVSLTTHTHTYTPTQLNSPSTTGIAAG